MVFPSSYRFLQVRRFPLYHHPFFDAAFPFWVWDQLDWLDGSDAGKNGDVAEFCCVKAVLIHLDTVAGVWVGVPRRLRRISGVLPLMSVRPAHCKVGRPATSRATSTNAPGTGSASLAVETRTVRVP